MRPAPTTAARSSRSARSSKSDDKVLVCTHATFRFAVDEFGVEAFDDRLIAVDEFHHVSANPDNKLGAHLGAVHRPRQGAHRRDDRLLLPRRRRGRARPAGRGEVRYRHLHLLRAAQRLRVSQAARHRLLLLQRALTSTTSSRCSTPPRRRSSTSPTSIRARARRTRSGRSSTSSRSWANGRASTPRPASSWSRRPDGRVLRIADLVDDDAAKRDRVPPR